MGKVVAQFYALAGETASALHRALPRTSCDVFVGIGFRDGDGRRRHRVFDEFPVGCIDEIEILHMSNRRLLPAGADTPKTDHSTHYDYFTITTFFGRLTPSGLTQSFFGFNGEPQWLSRDAQVLARALRRSMKAGVWVRNQKTGEEGYTNHLRYSPQAEELSRAGINLIPLGGAMMVGSIHPTS